MMAAALVSMATAAPKAQEATFYEVNFSLFLG